MDLKTLRYFLTAVEEGSISAAAQRLRMSQPNLSRQISSLERELGVTLLVRGNRRLELTEEGAMLRRRAVEILELADMAKEEIGSADDIRGTIRIGGGEVEGMRIVARAVRDFSSRYPNVRFQLYSGNAEDVTDRLDRGLLDFGVLIEPTDKGKYDFVQMPSDVRWGLMVREDDPLVSKGCAEPGDLLGRRLITSQQGMAMNGISGWLGRDVEKLDVIATYNLLYNASLMVSEGVGSALCLEGIVNTEGGNIRYVLLEPPLRVGLALVWKKGGVQGRAARLFLDALKGSFASASAETED